MSTEIHKKDEDSCGLLVALWVGGRGLVVKMRRVGELRRVRKRKRKRKSKGKEKRRK